MDEAIQKALEAVGQNSLYKYLGYGGWLMQNIAATNE